MRNGGGRRASERGVPFYDDLEGLLSREDVDGVVVTTPTVAHREVILVAARAGKHVFAEKVIAPTLGEARRWCTGRGGRGDLRLAAQALRRIHAGHKGSVGRRRNRRADLPARACPHDGALPSAANPQGWLPERFFDLGSPWAASP